MSDRAGSRGAADRYVSCRADDARDLYAGRIAQPLRRLRRYGPSCEPAAEGTDCATCQECGRLATAPRRLGDLAYARSGDKGIHANIGVIARRPDDFSRLCREVTAERVASYFGIADASRVVRYEVPNLRALNFVIHGILANPLRVDAQGKALGQVLLEMPLEELNHER